MDHPCSKCGATVQDGVAFCPNCGAPQIRVATPFGETPVTPPMPPGTPGEVQPPAEPVGPWAPQQQQGFRSPLQYDWRAGWRTAITVGVVIGLLSAVPLLGALCCLWMFAGGAISTWLYQRNSDRPEIPISVGFRTGALTGLVAFAVNALASTAKLFAGGGGAERQALKEAIEQSMERGSRDPQALAIMQRFADWIQTPQGFALMFTFSLLVVGLAFILFTGIGGALGASLFGKKAQYR